MHEHMYTYTYTHTYTYVCVCISLFFLTYKAESVGRHIEITKEERNNFTDYNPWF